MNNCIHKPKISYKQCLGDCSFIGDKYQYRNRICRKCGKKIALKNKFLAVAISMLASVFITVCIFSLFVMLYYEVLEPDLNNNLLNSAIVIAIIGVALMLIITTFFGGTIDFILLNSVFKWQDSTIIEHRLDEAALDEKQFIIKTNEFRSDK